MPIISAFYGIVIRMFYREHEWAQLHRAQLETNWEKMKAGQPLESIEPLSEEKP